MFRDTSEGADLGAGVGYDFSEQGGEVSFAGKAGDTVPGRRVADARPGGPSAQQSVVLEEAQGAQTGPVPGRMETQEEAGWGLQSRVERSCPI